MDSREYGSDSDSDDEDFLPSAAADDDDSGSDVSNFQEEGGDEESEELQKTKKRRKQSSKNKKKKKRLEEPANEEEPLVPTELTEEQRKERAKSLWADFLSDVKPKCRNSKEPAAHSTKTVETEKSVETESSVAEAEPINGEEAKAQGNIKRLFQEKENKAEKTETFEFAGEAISVERGRVGRAFGGGGGITSVLGQLKGKKKLSTLEKSKLDWESFKAKEGIAEDISTFNRGRHGFLERQDFLERADLRQFEIEKGMRASTRRSNR